LNIARRVLHRHHSRPVKPSTIMGRHGSKLYGFAWLLGLKKLLGSRDAFG
jgi:hypothetical protein